jgi:hypothetical protein
MIKILDGLNLEKIISDVSQASLEFRSFMAPPKKIDSFPAVLSSKIMVDGEWIESSFNEEDWDSVRGVQKTLRILLDTQLYRTTRPSLPTSLALQAREINLRKVGPQINIDQLTIVREELQQNGLRRYQVLPAELYRGENSLLKRCGFLPTWANQEIRSFYDVATNSFENLVKQLFVFQDLNMEKSAGVVAQDYMADSNMRFKEGMQQAYHEMFTKLLKKRLDGNEFNYVADKVLGLTNFGINFFSPNNKSILLTADGDFRAIEHFIYNTVLPKYIAKKAVETVEKYAPGRWTGLGISENGQKKLEKWAQEHIQAGLGIAGDFNRQQTNLIYNCLNGQIYSGYVHPMIARFVYDDRIGLAKSYVAEKSLLDRISPARIIEKLDNNSTAYNTWLRELGVRLDSFLDSEKVASVLGEE